jgi:protein OS-9
MTMTDSIMFIKETKTCHYILVVNTPRLCGEPGFRSPIDRRDETLIRCRQVVDAATLADADSSLPESNHPFPHRRASVTNPPPPLDAAEATSNSPSGESSGGGGGDDDGAANDGAGSLDHNALLRRALETILQKAGNPQGNGAGAGAGGGAAAPRVVVEEVGDGEMVIEFISEIAANDEEDVERRVEDLSRFMDSNMFEDALREAGFDVRDEEVEVEVEMEAERDEEGRKQQQQRGERTVNGAAKGRLRANAHPGRGPGRDEL